MKEVSNDQCAFLKRYRRHKIWIRITRVLILIAFFALWEISASYGLIDPFIFSSPSRLLRCGYELFTQQQLTHHIGMTLFETLTSFLLVILCTLIIATLLWFCQSASEALEPYLVILNSLPKSALAPLLIVWLGGNYKTIILTGMSVAIFGSVLSLYHAFTHTDPEKLLLIRTLGGHRGHILWKIILPGNIPTLLNLMKVNIGLCLVGVIIGEFIAAKRGLGYLIIYGSQVFKLDWVILSILLLCMIAMALYQGIDRIERRYRKE